MFSTDLPILTVGRYVLWCIIYKTNIINQYIYMH